MRKTRRDFLKTSGAMAAAASLGGGIGMMAGRQARAASETGGAARRPNVVIIYTDDQAKSQFGCYGGTPTPNIDRVAAEGVRFNRFYVSSALCSPSRFGMQTGRYASRAPGVLRLFTAGGTACPVQQIGDEHNRPAEALALPAVLRSAGYATGFVGKWHLGFMGERAKPPKNDDLPIDHPEVVQCLRHNFDLTVKTVQAAGYEWADAVYHDNVQPENFPKSARCHNPEYIAHRAIQFMGRNKEKPFLLSVNPTLVHYPPVMDSLKADRRITSVGLVDDIPAGIMPSRASVIARAQGDEKMARVIWLDDFVGALLKNIGDLGLATNTLVFVIADNGTGGKWTCYEGGTQTGCLARWTGRIPAGKVSDDLIQNVDIAPTVFDLCGVTPAKAKTGGEAMDGISFADVLMKGAKGKRTSAYLELGYQRAVLDDKGMKYLAVRYPEDIQKQAAAGKKFDVSGKAIKEGKGATPDELFDLASDPAEKKNLAGDPAQAETLARLKALMAEYSRSLPHRFGEFAQGG